MKKIMFALLVLMSMTFISCKSSSGSVKGDKGMEQVERKPMGVWKPMEWTSDAKFEKNNSMIVVDVPASKNNKELVCTNYNRFWISMVNEKGIDIANKDSFKGDFFDIKCEGNRLLVTFDDNVAAERSVDVTIQSGDIFSRIRFVQKSK